MFTRKEVAAEVYMFFVSIDDVITPLSIYLSVMIVFFLTFALFSSTPASEDGS